MVELNIDISDKKEQISVQNLFDNLDLNNIKEEEHLDLKKENSGSINEKADIKNSLLELKEISNLNNISSKLSTLGQEFLNFIHSDIKDSEFIAKYNNLPAKDKIELDKIITEFEKNQLDLETDSITKNVIKKSIDTKNPNSALLTIEASKKVKTNLKDIDSFRAIQKTTDIYASKKYQDIVNLIRFNNLKLNKVLVKEVLGINLPNKPSVDVIKAIKKRFKGDIENLQVDFKEEDLKQLAIKAYYKDPTGTINKAKAFIKKHYNIDVDKRYLYSMLNSYINGEEGLEANYPIFNGLAAAFLAPASTATKLAWFASGFVTEAPMTDALDLALEQDKWYIKYPATITALSAGALTEAGLAKAISKLGKGVYITGINATQALRNTERVTGKKLINWNVDIEEFSQLSNIKNLDDTEKTIVNKAINNNVTKEPAIEKVIPMPEAVNYFGKIIKNPKAVLIDINEKTKDLAKKIIDLKNWNDSKLATKKALNKTYFKISSLDIEKALDEGNIDEAINLLSLRTKEVAKSSLNIIDKITLPTKKEAANSFRRLVGKHIAFGLPGYAKDSLRYIPESIFNAEKSLLENYNKVVDSIFTGLSKKELDQLNELVNLGNLGGNDEVLARLYDFPSSVRNAYFKVRRFYAKMWRTTNDVLEDIAVNKGMFEYDGKTVIIEGVDNKTKKTIIKFLDDGIIKRVNAEDLNLIKNPIAWRDFYSHIVYSGDYAVTLVKNNKAKRVFQGTRETTQKYATAISDKVDDNTKIIRHPVNKTFDLIYEGKKNNLSNIIDLENLPTEKRILIDEAIEAFEEFGINYNDSYETIMNVLNEVLGKKKADKILKMISPTKITGRTAESPIGKMLDVKDSMKVYSKVVADIATSKNMQREIADKFKKEFGEFLEDPNNIFSKVKEIPNDTTGALRDSIILYQNQIKKIFKVPSETQIKLDKMWDEFVENVYARNKKLGKVVDKIHLNKFPTLAKKLGHTTKLALVPIQFPMQWSFALFGMSAHPDIILTKGHKLIKNIGLIPLALGARKYGKFKVFESLPKEVQALAKEIIDGGYTLDVMGHEGTLNTFMDFFVASGETMNKITNIAIAHEIALKQGLKIGTQEYREFVSTYFPKFAQSMSSLFDTPLSNSALTSWNIGQFKKFSVNFIEQITSTELTPKQKLAAMAGFYYLYGKEGIPVLSEATWAIDKAYNNLMQIQILNVVDAISIEDLKKDIDSIEGLTPEQRIKYKKELDKQFPQFKKKLKELDKTQLSKFLDDKSSLKKGIDNIIIETFKNLYNYGGINTGLSERLVWNNVFKSMEEYGARSILGTTINTLLDINAVNTSRNIFDAFKYGDKAAILTTLKKEGNRLFKVIASPLYTSVNGFIDLFEISNALSKDKLYDKEGNKINLDKIWDLGFDLEISKSQKRITKEGVEYKANDFITIGGILYRITGVEDPDISEKTKKYFKIKKALATMEGGIRGIALQVFTNREEGNLKYANELENALLLKINNSFGYDEIGKALVDTYIKEYDRLYNLQVLGFNKSGADKVKDISPQSIEGLGVNE